MTDILVHVADGTLEHFWRDKATASRAWWTLVVFPRELEVGDYICFESKGKLIARARVDSIDEEERECESTGKVRRGAHVTWHGEGFEKFDAPESVKPLGQGFRYMRET